MIRSLTAQIKKLLENVCEVHLMWEEFSQPQLDYIEETWQETDIKVVRWKSVEVWGQHFSTFVSKFCKFVYFFFLLVDFFVSSLPHGGAECFKFSEWN